MNIKMNGQKALEALKSELESKGADGFCLHQSGECYLINMKPSGLIVNSEKTSFLALAEIAIQGGAQGPIIRAMINSEAGKQALRDKTAENWHKISEAIKKEAGQGERSALFVGYTNSEFFALFCSNDFQESAQERPHTEAEILALLESPLK